MDLDCAAVRSRPERLPWVLGAALLLVTSTWSTARAQEGGSAGTAPALTEAQAQSATEGPEIILVEPRSDDEINADLAVLRTLSSRSQADVSQSGVSIAEAKTYVEEAKQRLKGLESQIDAAKEAKNKEQQKGLEKQKEQQKLEITLRERLVEFHKAEAEAAEMARKWADSRRQVLTLESEYSALRRTQSAAKGGESRSAQVAAEKQRVKSDVESTEGRIIDAQIEEAKLRQEHAERSQELAEKRKRLFEARRKIKEEA